MAELTQMAPQLLVAAVAMAWLTAVAADLASGPVSRARLALFARRHNLVITAANGNQVIRYLATTRRWRVGGAWFSALALLAMSIGLGSVQVSLLVLAVGWFGGALIAEVRLAPVRAGPRRAASVAPRLPESYLARPTWLLLPAAGWVSVAVAVLILIVAARGGGVTGPAAVGWSTLAIVLAVVVDVVRHGVLRRGQPVAAPDVLAADDAMRSRSLHVLTGCGFVLVSFCVIGQLTALQPALTGTGASIVGLLQVLVGCACTLCGIVVVTLRWPVGHGPVTNHGLAGAA
jgi:hypothetical protein